MKKLAIVSVILLLAASPACRSPRAAQEPPLRQCLDDLKTIPAMSAVLASSSRNPDREETRSLEGMQMALVLKGMVLSAGEPEHGIDNWCEFENSPENFNQLLDALRHNSMPPTLAFVTGFYSDRQLLARWVESGNLLGNMTFSRKKAKRRALQAFLDDCARNDEFLASLGKKDSSKYFSHVRFKLSRNSPEHDQIDAWMKSKGYSTVWSTIDPPTNKFADVYCSALARADNSCSNLTKEHFKKLLLDLTLRARTVARKRTGREVKHVLMLRTNQFTCDVLGDLLSWYRGLGVQFISIEEAMKDPIQVAANDEGKPQADAIMREAKRRQKGRWRKGREE